MKESDRSARVPLDPPSSYSKPSALAFALRLPRSAPFRAPPAGLHPRTPPVAAGGRTAPGIGRSDISGALIGFASQWDIQVDVPEVPLVAIAGADEAKLAANLPRLSRLLEQRSVLMVLDNLESLLRENGQWRDPRDTTEGRESPRTRHPAD